MRNGVHTLLLAGLLFALAASSACVPDVEPDVFSLPRCVEVPPRCGPEGDESCCADPLVIGGIHQRINDPLLEAEVADFHLDRFEVTVGRFRQFVASYPGNKPRPGAGRHPFVDGSGWDPAWDAELPVGEAELRAELQCSEYFHTWTDEPGANELMPVNCLSWYVAFAFCAWDEGRLPTGAEWSHAAVGGDEQRLYPWGDAAPDPSLAVYGCDTAANVCLIPRTGSRSPQGDGKWGHADLAGSMSEWVLDHHGTLPTPCKNCAHLQDENLGRDSRGGDHAHPAELLATTVRTGFDPASRESFFGLRCVHDR